MDKLFLKLWILTEVSKLENNIKSCKTMEEGFELRGRLSILQEMFEFFELKKIEDQHMVHSNYWSTEESLVECWLAEKYKIMKKLYKDFVYWFDFVVGYLLTHPSHRPRYHKYMYDKWGTRYCSKEDLDEYLKET